MLTNKPALRILVLSILPAGLFFAAAVHGQVRIEIPEVRMPDFAAGGLGAIMDFQSMTSGSGRSVSMTIENGVKKIRGQEGGIKAYIEEDPNNGIIIRVTRQYGAGQMDVLMEEHPDLYMSMKDFPEQSEGAEVEITLGITRTYEASDTEELREKYPDAFEVYEKFSGANSGWSGAIIPGRRFGGLRAMPGLDFRAPEIRIVPADGGERFQIDPSDIKIHEDEKDQKAEGGKDDKDT